MAAVRLHSHLAIVYFLLGFFVTLSAAPWVTATASTWCTEGAACGSQHAPMYRLARAGQ